ncbi:TPA: phage tail protein [Streptococcus suis]|nr:phage tail protein [Streptococcus suis]HEM5126313.1 phage tail protein [Streptococcus suis]HEM5135061.1 phage tail protein [Streptococcus suis]
MLLTIHDASLRKVAFIDNDKQATLNYFNDTWTRYLETGSSTFDFTVFKKAIISDTGRKRAYNYLNEKAFVSFQYKGKTYLHTIRKVEENEQIIKCYGINLNLELINEYANPFKSEQPKTFKEYCEAMDLLNFTLLTIGVNEISDKRIKAEWTGQDTKLNRLLSLAKKFGAEIEFDTHLNADSSIKSFVVNVYHENDDIHQGVGRISPTVLTYGKNLKTLTRTVDKTNIYNMVRPTGRTENGDIVTISGLSAWSVNNDKGEREFYQAGEGLYAPLSMQMYPSAFTSSTTNDQWIRKDMQVESANPEVIRSMAYRELKKNCYPAVTYEAEGFADLEIGDTVKVYDDGFSPVLLLEMRVSEQSISFTNPKNNKTTFSNAKALENLLSNGIQERLDRMIEDAKPYTVKVSTDNGTAFKNGTGQSIVTPTLYKGGKPLTANVTWRWSLDGAVKTGMTYTVRGADVTDTSTLTVAAYIGNDEVAVDELTFVNVLDGRDGVKGEKGDPGQRGSDGLPGRDGVGIRSTTVTYASSTNGTTAPTTGWTAAVPTVAPGNYLWTKTVWAYTDGNTETGYTVSRIGRDGNTGRDGIAGKDGVGIRSTTITYGKSTSGTIQPTSWTSQVPSVPNGQFLWTKTVWAYTDNTSETGYSVAKMGETGPKGEQGIQGLSYHLFTTNYQYNQTSISQYSTPGYTGTWVVNEDTGLVKIGDTVSMSVYHTKKLGLVYILATVKAIASDRSLTTVSKGLIDKGEQGIPGEKGADGRTQYTHIAYADNATGGGFSQTDQTKAYIGMYQDFTAINSTNPTSYRWSKWKGSDGAQGIPGPKGADGRTPYIHWAYSDSADGTGLTTSDNGQRYIGHYSDYTQADSTDKTKYRWADRWAKIEVGGINLLTGTDEETVYISKDPAAMEFLRTPYDLAKVFDKHGLVTYTLSFDLKADKDGAVHVYMQNGSGSRYGGLHADIGVTTEWKRYHVTFTPTEGNMELSESFLVFYGVYGTGVVPYARKFKLEKGTVPTDWSLAIEDWQLELNSKADQAFTQEQINALNEKNQILETEMQAKASMDALSDLKKAYQSFVKSNADSRAKAEADLAEAGRRIELLVTQFGGFKELKTFIDTYMSSSNEGLIIGKNDASSTIKVSSDRISMFSAGKEVMYISQGVIHIDNGIFTASVQIGRFRTEQYHLNADMNVIRYVG